jgi:hypothetical protein
LELTSRWSVDLRLQRPRMPYRLLLTLNLFCHRFLRLLHSSQSTKHNTSRTQTTTEY